MIISKKVLSLVTFVFLGCSLSAQAGNLSDIHAMKHNISAQDSTSKRLGGVYYPTDVHVRNLSSFPITVKVPGSSFYDSLNPMQSEDIYFDSYYDAVELSLYDDEGFLIFRDYVANHQTVYVEDTFYRFRSTGEKQAKVKARLG